MSTTPTPAPAPTAGMHDASGARYRRAVIALVAVILCAAFALSATALAAVATWAGIPAGSPLRWALAVLLDAGVLAATATALHERPRGQRGRVVAAWVTVGALTVLSAGLNSAHAWATSGALGWQRTAGAILAAVPPTLVWCTSHALAWVATTTDAEREAAAEAALTAQVAAARREARARAAMARATTEVEDGAAAAAPAEVDAPTPTTAPTCTTTPAASAPRPQRPTLDAATRDRVAAMRATGASERQIATELGLSKSTVHRLVATGDATGVGTLLEAVA